MWHAGDAFVVKLTPQASTSEVGRSTASRPRSVTCLAIRRPTSWCRFDVEGASEPDAEPSDEDGSETTDDGGNAEHCYTGPDLPGEDVIRAYGAPLDRRGRAAFGSVGRTRTVSPVASSRAEDVPRRRSCETNWRCCQKALGCIPGRGPRRSRPPEGSSARQIRPGRSHVLQTGTTTRSRHRRCQLQLHR